LQAEVKTKLLASMHAGRLVVVCGAGLSMAAPSSLPAAWRVAEASFDKYALETDPACDPAMRHDLEAFAQHFVGLHALQSVFIESLVPWQMFVKPPNAGHAAVADFLVTRAATAALSANYDTLIEQSAVANGFDFQNSLDGDEATTRSRTQSPLLKFHGCATRDRMGTVWAPSQLGEPPIADRIAKSKTWMAANLRQKDLLVVGFWSDWAYLNTLLGTVLDGLAPLSVTVIDLADAGALQAKAPDLWALATGPKVEFTHVQESGADALTELRKTFSQNYLRGVLAAGRPAFEASIGLVCDPAWLEPPDFDNETLYSLRRDAEGVPSGQPASRSKPSQCEIFGVFHLLLRQAGAAPTALGYDLAGRSIRVVNGAGAVLNQLRTKFVEAPAVAPTDIVVAAGATNLPLPGSVVRPGSVGSFIRPTAMGDWYDLDGARAELGI
jgi:hypothetical protein